MNLKILSELNRILKANPSLSDDLGSMCQVVNGVFNIELDVIETSDTIELSDIIDNAVLSQYFSRVWQPETKKYKYSGLSIIDEVNAMNPKNVIDVGCGYNEFSGKIYNLIGIDPYNDRADIKSSILDFEPLAEYDVAISLGSINFGSSDIIIKEMSKLVSIVKEGGLLYFRVNPGEQHAAFEAKWIDFFDWDPTFISNIAKTLNCEVKTLRQDVGNRLYFVLKKL